VSPFNSEVAAINEVTGSGRRTTAMDRQEAQIKRRIHDAPQCRTCLWYLLILTLNRRTLGWLRSLEGAVCAMSEASISVTTSCLGNRRSVRIRQGVGAVEN